VALTLVQATGTNVFGTTSAAPAYPTGIQADDAVFLAAGACHSTVVTYPAITGWTLIYDLALGGGVIAAGTGPRRCGLYRKDVVDGTETGTVTVTPTGGSDVVGACIIAVRATSKNMAVTYAQGQDTSAGTATSITADSIQDQAINDLMLGWGVVPANTNISGQAFTATGATHAAAAEFSDAGSASGDTVRCSWISSAVTAGLATAATVYAASSTHSQGEFFICIKEVVTPQAKSRRPIRFYPKGHPLWKPPRPKRFIPATESGAQFDEVATDSAGLTDTVEFEQDLVRTDSAGLTDTTLFTESIERTDSAGLTDTVLKTQSNVVTDSAGLTDTHTEELVKTVDATDSAGLTDTVLKTIEMVRTDDAGLTDTILKSINLERIDSAGLTDTHTEELIKTVIATDSAGLTDNALLTEALERTDSAGLTDTALKSIELVRTDSAGLTDTTTIVAGRVIDQTDDAGLTDTTLQRIEKVQTDSAGLTDTTEKIISRVVTDLAGLTDTSTVVKLTDVTRTDSAGLTDTVSSVATYTRDITDLAGLTDTVLVEGVSPAVPPETLESEGRSATAVEGQGTATGIDGHGEGTTIEGQGGSSTLDGGGRAIGSGGIDG